MKSVDLREKDLAVLRETLHPFPVVREARVYGPRATGEARRAPDLDLAISAPEATVREWADISEAPENAALIYEIDLVRPEQITHNRLKEKIQRERIVVYSGAKTAAGEKI